MSVHELMGARRPDPLTENKLYNAARPTVTLLVEGELDTRFWRMWCVALVRRMGGRPNALAELDRARADDEACFLAVLDADFDRLEDRLPTRDDIIWTDAHDLETTLLGLPVLEKLLRSELAPDALATFEDTWGETFRARLMRHGATLGRLRWLNTAERDKLGLVFSKPKGSRGAPTGFNFTRFDKYDRCVDTAWAPCLAHAIKAIVNYSNAQHLARRNLADECAALPAAPTDQLCNGHDLLGFLKLGVETVRGGKKKGHRRTVDEWARTLVTACERQWVATTAMWQALDAWQATHPRFPVLRRGG